MDSKFHPLSGAPAYAPEPRHVDDPGRHISIGLPSAIATGDRRFPLTPEGVEMLVERGFRVAMESGAAAAIHYDDDAYARRGASVATRTEALRSDIVICLPALSVADVKLMKRGAMLLTMLDSAGPGAHVIAQMMARGITMVAVNLFSDARGNHPFADILAEIDGRAAMSMASALLADTLKGKGILLGGVAGIVPCEVAIIGSGISALAAARSALGLGATVRLFDNDAYALRAALHELGPGVAGSALHPNVLRHAYAAADVIIATPARMPGADFSVTPDEIRLMKRGVIAIDCSESPGHMFPSLPIADLADGSSLPVADLNARRQRVCYIRPGATVPRTVAMALSNTFLTMLGEIMVSDAAANAIKMSEGMQRATCLFMGKVTNPAVARMVGVRSVDISIFLQLS